MYSEYSVILEIVRAILSVSGNARVPEIFTKIFKISELS